MSAAATPQLLSPGTATRWG